jgi:PPOX class probable F420-dependent enzyme
MLWRLPRALVQLGGRLLARTLDPTARGLEPAHGHDFQSLAGRAWCMLLTRRRDGRLVPTPLAFARDGDRLLMRTAADSPKVRRIRRDPSVAVAPCDVRGRPLGPAVRARGRLLRSPEQRAAAERAITVRYGLAGRIWSGLVRAGRLDAAYIEVTPFSPGTEANGSNRGYDRLDRW